MWSERLTLILRSFLKLERFGYKNNNGDFLNQQYLRTFQNLSLLLKLSSQRSFFHSVCENCHAQKWLKLTKSVYSQSNEDEHDKQVVSDTMYKT